MPRGLTISGTSDADPETPVSKELVVALSRANDLQGALVASIRREGALEQQVRDLQQQLDSRDFIEQLKR